MKNEMVNILAEDLEDGVAIRVGVQRVEYQPGTVGPWAHGVADYPFAIIQQGNDEIWIPASLWAKFVAAATPIVARGAGAA